MIHVMYYSPSSPRHDDRSYHSIESSHGIHTESQINPWLMNKLAGQLESGLSIVEVGRFDISPQLPEEPWRTLAQLERRIMEWAGMRSRGLLDHKNDWTNLKEHMPLVLCIVHQQCTFRKLPAVWPKSQKFEPFRAVQLQFSRCTTGRRF